MRKRKNIQTILLVLLLTSLLAACGNTTASNSETESETEVSTESHILETEPTTEEVLEPETETSTEVPEEESTEVEETVEETVYTYTDIEKIMYAKSPVNLRSGPATTFEKVGGLSQNQEVKVTGQCNETNWYRIVWNDTEAFVSNNYLVNEKVEVVVNNTPSNDAGSVTSNPGVVESQPVVTPEASAPTVVVGPEPAYGSIAFEGHPQDGYIWQYIDSTDTYLDGIGWVRLVSNSTWFGVKQSEDTLKYYSYIVYPERTDVGTHMQRIDYPTFWVYFGDGAF